MVRLEQQHGTGKALTILAHKLARAVYYMLKRAVAFELATCMHGQRRGVGEPGAYLDGYGISLSPALCTRSHLRLCTQRSA